jgi:hypothetical protein
VIDYHAGPEGWVAREEVIVGTTRRTIAVPLGVMASPPDPGGLRAVPVLMAARGLVALVEAGVRRAGGRPETATLPRDDGRPLGGRLLATSMEGAEVLVVLDGDASAVEAVRALDGRPVPALPLDDPDALSTLVEALTVDVNLAIPGLEGRRDELREILAPLELERLHHPVEVDPRPAFDELGLDPRDASLGELAAGAAGVLAGRMVAANRRWRA